MNYDDLDEVGPHLWRITLSGTLEPGTTAMLVRKLDDLEFADRQPTVLVDVVTLVRHTQERETNSYAVVNALKRYQQRGGSVRFVCKNQQLRAIFGITGLNKIFPIYADEESAMK